MDSRFANGAFDLDSAAVGTLERHERRDFDSGPLECEVATHGHARVAQCIENGEGDSDLLPGFRGRRDGDNELRGRSGQNLDSGRVRELNAHPIPVPVDTDPETRVFLRVAIHGNSGRTRAVSNVDSLARREGSSFDEDSEELAIEGSCVELYTCS
jgi:hypothetical protein